MKKLGLLFGIIISAMLFAGCNFNKDGIIKVNGDIITKEQYEETFNTVVKNTPLAQMGINMKADDDSYINLMIKERVINELVLKKLIDQEIKKRNVRVSDKDIEKYYGLLIDKIGSKEKFNEILKQNQISQAQFKKDLKEEVKLQKLIDTLAVVSISDSDVEKYYKKNISKFKYPDKVKASHILIAADPLQIRDTLLAKEENKNLTSEQLNKKVDEELNIKKRKAEKILKELKLDPTKFAQMAKENSDDTASAQEGGDLGFFTKEEMVKEFSDVAFKQRPNTISNLVATPYGYHIIMVTDRMKAGVEPLAKVKFELKNALEQQEKTQILQKFIEATKKNAKIEFLDENYNPEIIQKKIKEAQAKNPSLMEAQSAKE